MSFVTNEMAEEALNRIYNKTLDDEFEKLYEEKITDCFLSTKNRNIIKQFISELRKKDEEELINRFKDIDLEGNYTTTSSVISSYAEGVIKNYYNKDECICNKINSRNCPIHQ